MKNFYLVKVGNDYVERVGFCTTDPVDPLGVSAVTNVVPAANAYGLAVRTVAPTPHTKNSLASTNATSVKGSAGTLYGIAASNINAAARFLKLYNKATAPTVGTDTPVLTITIPASGYINFDTGLLGMQFTLGIAYALTGLATDADTTAVAANDIKVFLNYQ